MAAFRHGDSGRFTLDERMNSLAKPQTLLCRCEDVALEQVRHQPDWNTAKLSSRCGMGHARVKSARRRRGSFGLAFATAACAFNAGQGGNTGCAGAEPK